ncbi:hypothetical protein GWK47_018491 [Chionoecetes opilio]|uniref:Uncharacterized protein n=1 Tax=Chionoecetes opilio TaxID=41210 RepID=A0A8J5CIL4_CHIOP|nr:hypothetical protein GWK47_018491 [Chionoecetes opilio]
MTGHQVTASKPASIQQSAYRSYIRPWKMQVKCAIEDGVMQGSDAWCRDVLKFQFWYFILQLELACWYNRPCLRSSLWFSHGPYTLLEMGADPNLRDGSLKQLHPDVYAEFLKGNLSSRSRGAFLLLLLTRPMRKKPEQCFRKGVPAQRTLWTQQWQDTVRQMEKLGLEQYENICEERPVNQTVAITDPSPPSGTTPIFSGATIREKSRKQLQMSSLKKTSLFYRMYIAGLRYAMMGGLRKLEQSLTDALPGNFFPVKEDLSTPELQFNILCMVLPSSTCCDQDCKVNAQGYVLTESSCR